MKAKRLTTPQRAALIKIERQGPVATIAEITARALIRQGYVEQASVWPVPVIGIACALTTKGKTWDRE